MSEHTKTPLIQDDVSTEAIRDADGNWYASCHGLSASSASYREDYEVRAKRAAHIVRCVNAFDLLFEACAEIVLAVGDECPTDEPRDWYLAVAYDRAVAALKLAKGTA